jgi:2,4-dienoyl-CoA reductase-like NADH-dependent reductase (Old Yellow Enzyme family)
VRFARELIERVRKCLGPEYPLTIRMAGNDFVRDSNTDTETPEFAKIYEQAGVDAINVTGGSVGLETAVFIAAKGTITPEILHFLLAYEAVSPERLRELMFQGSSKVTVFEMLPRIGQDVGKSTRWILFDNLSAIKFL